MIELPKSYRMYVLVLKMITLNSSYGLSKIAIKLVLNAFIKNKLKGVLTWWSLGGLPHITIIYYNVLHSLRRRGGMGPTTGNGRG